MKDKPYFLSKYVLQVHDAHLAGNHYDLRIQIPNKKLMASWAIPKAHIPKVIGEKVLAIRTMDHGLHWYSIDEMDIEDGAYGAGHIKTIQKGNAEIEGWSETYITFTVSSGDTLNGRYALIKFKGVKRTDKKDNLFILIKLNKKETYDEKSKISYVKKLFIVPQIPIATMNIIKGE